MVRVLALLVCLAVAVSAEKARYDNYTVFRVTPQTHEQLNMLVALQENADGVSFWREPSRLGAPVDVMVAPHKKPEFQQLATRIGVEASVFIANVQEKIENEAQEGDKASKSLNWTSYGRLADIYGFLDDLVAKFPKQVTAILGGTTFEGRQIRGVKVSFGANKPGVFIEGGIHAREWISPATVTYILNEVLTSTDPAVRKIVESYDWYVIPSFNPDGYEYTHTNDRLWRKTRSTHGGLCYGADPNRNWDFHWLQGGSSSSACSDIFAGATAFSEVETKTLSKYITTIADKLNVYLAFHSYAQDFLIPYGFNSPTISDFAQHETVGKRAATALAKRYNTQYVVGKIADLMGVSTGGSVDWVKGVYNTDLVYAIELRDTGANGFVLPPAQIIPTAKETLDAVISILTDALP